MNPLEISPSLLPILIARLTPRQLEIIGLLAEGKSSVDTAAILSISREAVTRHIMRACQKLEVENRIQLIVIFVMWKVNE